jgi:hypothetical protein
VALLAVAAVDAAVYFRLIVSHTDTPANLPAAQSLDRKGIADTAGRLSQKERDAENPPAALLSDPSIK